jgi:hypothetical protein|tara:strand:- start:38 stop:298 length:261 start_codon:yes stop_codon:yes gene_type:complete
MSRYVSVLINTNGFGEPLRRIHLTTYSTITNIRRKTVNLPTLECMHVSERMENMYAQIIAEEDIGENYGEKAIIQERLSISGQHIF